MPDDYNLPRHTAESSRLDVQHNAYVKIVGYVLHPRINDALPENARVADVGTGTGAWLQELAKTCPSTWSLHGFDISDAQFPQNGVQSRIEFDQLNITEDVPQQLQGQFDVVHLRLLVCGLVDEQWATAARNALQLLKPGGWIQWHESQFKDLQTVPNEPGASIENNQRLIQASISGLNKHGKLTDSVRHLRETVQASGFEDVDEDVVSTDRAPDEVRESLMDVQYKALEAISGAQAKADSGLFGSIREYGEVLKRAKEEIEDDKARYQWNMRVVTGRRPAA